MWPWQQVGWNGAALQLSSWFAWQEDLLQSFVNAHNVYPKELHLTAHQEANQKVTLFSRSLNVAGKNGLAFRSMKSSSGFLKKVMSYHACIWNYKGFSKFDYASGLEQGHILGRTAASAHVKHRVFFPPYLICFVIRNMSFCCLQDKSVQMTIFCSWSYASVALQALQKSYMFHFPVYKFLLAVHW